MLIILLDLFNENDLLHVLQANEDTFKNFDDFLSLLLTDNKVGSLCKEFNMISYLKRWTPNFLQNCQNSHYPLCFCVIVSSS